MGCGDTASETSCPPTASDDDDDKTALASVHVVALRNADNIVVL